MFSNGKYEVLNNAIDLKRYCFDSNQCEKVREQYNILATDKVIGHVGKMVRQKNYEFILDVFEEMLNQVDVCMSGYKCTVKGYRDVQYEATCHPGEKAKAELFPRMLGSIPDKKDSVDMSVCGALCNAELIRIHHLCFPSERVIWR